MEIDEVVNIIGPRRHFNTKLCIVCEENSPSKESSLTKLLEKLIARVDEKVLYRKRVEDLAKESGSSLKGKNCIYHRQFFQQVTNENTLQRFLDTKSSSSFV